MKIYLIKIKTHNDIQPYVYGIRRSNIAEGTIYPTEAEARTAYADLIKTLRKEKQNNYVQVLESTTI